MQYEAMMDRRHLLHVATQLAEALRDAEAMDQCQPTSGGDADTYETIKERRFAALKLYDAPAGEAPTHE